MTLSNDQIREMLKEFTHSGDAYTNQQLTEFAQKLMKTNDPTDSINAIASEVVQELIPMSWIACVKEVRTQVSGCGLKEGKEAVERALVVYLREQLAVFEGKVKRQTDNTVSDFSIDTTEFEDIYGFAPHGWGEWSFVNEEGYSTKRIGVYKDMTKTLATGHYKLTPYHN